MEIRAEVFVQHC